MKVRLAFAVAAHLDPEILIIDEVLAVGDLAFQQKCLGKMNDVRSDGRTILFVSHNMGPVEGLCDQAIMLDEGRIAYNGEVDEAIRRYRASMFEEQLAIDLEHRTDRKGTGDFRFTKIIINEGEPVLTNTPLKVDIHYHARKSTPRYPRSTQVFAQPSGNNSGC